MVSEMTSAALAAFSQHIDDSYGQIDPEAHLWRRTMKLVSEAGEAQDAIGGILGENPRKGVTHTREQAIGELLDVAVSALGAVEHMKGNDGSALRLLDDKIMFVAKRMGIIK